MLALIKKQVSKFIRSTGLALAFDRLRFYKEYIKNYSANQAAVKANSAFKFPPAYFLYETYALNYKVYFTDGLQTAKEIRDVIQPFISFNDAPKSILDWGCGPARVVRHWPAVIGQQHTIYGSDYNGDYISWNSTNISNVTFIKNQLEPPIDLTDASVDLIYSLSIITHLSDESQVSWIKELHRLLKPNGVLLITSQGNQFKNKLVGEEIVQFEKGKLVVRNAGTEGHRVYAAFQPEAYMKDLLKDFKLLGFIPGGDKDSIHGLQDTWIVQK